MNNDKFQRELFNTSSKTAKSKLGGSFHDLHTIAKIEIEKLQKEIEKLQDTIRFKKNVDKATNSLIKEQSKKVKHLFPLENTAGYGQLCDKVLELTAENSDLRLENHRFKKNADNYKYERDIALDDKKVFSEENAKLYGQIALLEEERDKAYQSMNQIYRAFKSLGRDYIYLLVVLQDIKNIDINSLDESKHFSTLEDMHNMAEIAIEELDD